MPLALRDYLAWLNMAAAKPGDPRGGFLEGQPDQLQKLPSGDQGHGGEFVVNAEATKRFRPILEAINRAVPPATGVKPERPSTGRSYFGGGESGVTGEDAGVGVGIGAADTGGLTPADVDTAVAAEQGDPNAGAIGMGIATGDDPFAPSPPDPSLFGFALSDAHGHPDAVSAALTGALSGLTPGSPTAAGTALGLAAALTPAGAIASTVGDVATAAAEAQTAAMTGLTGLTAGEISDAMAAENTAAADAAAGTGLGPGGQGGAAVPESSPPWRPNRPPATVSLRDYLTWLQSATTVPVPRANLREALLR